MKPPRQYNDIDLKKMSTLALPYKGGYYNVSLNKFSRLLLDQNNSLRKLFEEL